MNNTNKRVYYLFDLYYKKQATPEEQKELFELLDATHDEQLIDLMRKVWNEIDASDILFEEAKSKTILNNILNAGYSDNSIVALQPKRSLAWIKIAAAIIVSISIGAYFLAKKNRPGNIQLAKNQLLHDALPGNNKATLTLGNGSVIVLDSTGNGVVAKQGNILITKNNTGQVSYKPAPVENNNTIAFNTIATPRGGQYQVVLPDGSKVWLNAISSIKFPTVFTGAERHVEITGEAYFEVTKNPAMPFVVKVNHEEVKVLGTHFCIMAYDDEKVIKTSLLEGSIMLTSEKSIHILKPGNQAILNTNGDVKIVEHANVDEAVAWKNGLFQYNDEGIEGIMRQAARWYDVDVNYQGKIPTRQFNGKISRNVKLSELLGMFKYAGVNFSIDGKKVTVGN